MVLHGNLATAAAQLFGLVVIIAGIAGAAAFLYRSGVRERLPDGLAVLIGLSVVAVSVGATSWLNQVIGGSDALISASAALRNIGVFLVCAGGAYLGARAGDRIARDVALAGGSDHVDNEMSRLVEAVGRVITVELPEEIDDVVGYDPVPTATKEELQGKRFLFPRRLTVAELRERLVARLKTDYAVGHVDVELAADGTVEYLALGSRAAGIGPTLPPETAAVAIRADPAHAASAGDLVQVWETNPSRRVLTAELRGVAADVVTLAIDAADTPKIDPGTRYRLVTLPVDDRPDREFASLLRAADETMATVEVGAGCRVDGATVRDIEVSVVAITDAEGDVATLPTGDRTVTAGDVLYAIGTPEALRRLETAAEPSAGTEPAGVTGGDPAESATAEPGGTGDQEQRDASPATGTATSQEPAASGTVSDDGANADEASSEDNDTPASGLGESTAGPANDRGAPDADSVPGDTPVREDETQVFEPETDIDPLDDKATPGTDVPPGEGAAEEASEVSGDEDVDDVGDGDQGSASESGTGDEDPPASSDRA